MSRPSPHHLPRLIFRLQRLPRGRDWQGALLAIPAGCAAGLGATAIYRMIELLNTLLFSAPYTLLATGAATLPWWQVLAVPTGTALIVGLTLQYILRGPPQGLAQVVEISQTDTINAKSRAMTVPRAIAMALLASLSIGGGASAGREGPAVHLGSALALALSRCRASWVPHRLAMVAAATAGAVSASFNAPLAGIFFAFEVVAAGRLRSSLLVPIVIGAVAGTVLHRLVVGTSPVFGPVEHSLNSLWEMPAFLLLGVVCGLAGVTLMVVTFHIEDVTSRWRLPRWLLTTLGGAGVGGLALIVPQVLGVGYEATNAALNARYSLLMLITVALAKIAASAISIATGSVGGLFAPTLVIGAMAGGAFGIVAGQFGPDLASNPGVYAMAGIGALGAAVMNAPLSTTLIVFEMTGDYPTTLAVLASVGMAMAVYGRLLGTDTYTLQLRRRAAALRQP